MKNLLGGKGANLAEMTGLGFPVPPGFTITTEVCNYFLQHKGYPLRFEEQLLKKLAELEKDIGKKFGDAKNPLLVSVRSGARASMPGMMNTVLNLGLNDETVLGLSKKTGNERFTYDSYRRFIQMFGDVVLGVPHDAFEEALTEAKKECGATLDTDLASDDLKALVARFKEIVLEHTEKPFPADPVQQLRRAIEAVFNSWNIRRAQTYRKLHGIPNDWGTAVNIQSMVFGNMGKNSGTGVCFTRDPATGENIFYGEFLLNAQGEDVVAGIRTPEKLSTMEKHFPKLYKQLCDIRKKLELHYRDMQDIEFTVEEGRLFILQTRNGKRTGQAAVKIAVDMVGEKLITKQEAILRVSAPQLSSLLHPSIDPQASVTVIGKGLPASPGAACGKIVFTADAAHDWAERGEKVILARKETSPEDIHGMHAAQGMLTTQGGQTSHCAVVSRGMGKCAVVGAGNIMIDAKNKVLCASGHTLKEGDIIAINGSTGEVFLGEIPLCEPALSKDFETLMSWADAFRTLRVRTNADTPEDTRVAREFGAEGIGLCRTEHMFFENDRIHHVREMILAADEKARRKALAKLLPYQRQDFEAIFAEMNGYPVTVRLLDPPLHEFLPDKEEKIAALAQDMELSIDEVKKKIASLHELNPMLGHRGCRLGITYPEIYEMQVEAILTAAVAVSKQGLIVQPEIEVPLVGNVSEFLAVKKTILGVIERYKSQMTFHCKIGTMIEVPRAALTAATIAREADFFSFGTNDLTQMTLGFSRDDVGKFVPVYLEKGILKEDPFETIDQEGVGALMRLCTAEGRKANRRLEVGICGEHGGEAKSVEFCHAIGLNYVSCSPYRVPIARLAAAQAALQGSQRK